jgi:hypothetical protein
VLECHNNELSSLSSLSDRPTWREFGMRFCGGLWK